MGSLLHIVLALAALGVVEGGVSTGWVCAPLTLALCAVPHLVGAASRALFMRGRFRMSVLLLRALQESAPALYFASLAAFGWRETASKLVGHELSFFAWPHFGLFLLGAPFVVFEWLSIDARARVIGSTRVEQKSWRNFQARMFVSTILPIFVYVALASAVGWSEPLRVNIEEVGIYGGAFATLLLVGMALILPTLLRNAWDTAPLAVGIQRDLLLEVARRAQFRCRALLVWNTGNMMANAAIVGVSARSRVVLFSDSLLMQLDLRQLGAVFAHEIGHAVRHHVPLFGAWALVFFLGADLLAQWAFPHEPWFAGAVVVGVMGAWFVLFSFVSRRCELEADLYSLELLGDREALIGALERVGGRLRDVASWRHFSISDRVRFLDRAAHDPMVGLRLRSQLRLWMRCGCVLLVVALGAQFATLWSSFDRDRTQVDLRLGRYASAAELIARGADVDSGLRSLVERAQTLQLADGNSSTDALRAEAVRPTVARPDDVRALERAARAAMRAGDVDAALEWLALGALRGDPDLTAVGESLRLRLSGEGSDQAGALPSEIDRLWRADLAGLGLPTPATR